jgi:hypothetical protein
MRTLNQNSGFLRRLAQASLHRLPDDDVLVVAVCSVDSTAVRLSLITDPRV